MIAFSADGRLTQKKESLTCRGATGDAFVQQSVHSFVDSSVPPLRQQTLANDHLIAPNFILLSQNMNKFKAVLWAVCISVTVTALGLLFIINHLPIPCVCDFHDSIPENNVNDWRMATTLDFEDLVYFGGYLHYHHEDRPDKMKPKYVILHLNSIEHKLDEGYQTEHLFLKLDCALIDMTLLNFKDTTIVSRMHLNLTRPSEDGDIVCEVVGFDINIDKSQHYRCYNKRVYPCYSLNKKTEDPFKLVANLVLDVFEFEVDGEINKHEMGAFSRPAKDCGPSQY